VVPAADQDLQGLLGVSATSPTDIWAVGWMGSPTGLHTAVEHYDGTGWTRSPSPGSAFLLGVAAASPADAWAVGWDFDGHAVILHYDGTGWVPVPAAVPNFGILAGVAASSPGSVWAVGGLLTSDQFGPVALHLRCC